MRWILLVALALCGSLPLFAQQPESKQAERENARDLLVPRTQVVAKVNDEIILQGEVQHRIATDLEQLKKSCRDEETYTRKATELQTLTLRGMVEDKVLSLAAAAEGIQVQEDEVDRELATQVRRRGSREQLVAELSQRGMTWEEYRERVRDDMGRRELILRRLGISRKDPTQVPRWDVVVRPGDIQRYYAEHLQDFHVPEHVKARLIRIAFDRSDRAGKRAEAESVLRQIHEGADMALLALWYSADHAAEGGLYGWSEREQFPREVAEALFGLAKGALGPVVECEDAYVLVRCEDSREARQRRLEEDEVQNEIRGLLHQGKVNEMVSRIKRKLITEAYIEPADLFDER